MFPTKKKSGNSDGHRDQGLSQKPKKKHPLAPPPPKDPKAQSPISPGANQIPNPGSMPSGGIPSTDTGQF